MDFGKILDRWENDQNNKKKKKQSHFDRLIDEWLLKDETGIEEKKEVDKIRNEVSPSQARKILRDMKPQSELDLHGLQADEAVAKTNSFIEEAHRMGLKKVLIIHGKGNHSSREPVLGKAIRRYLEKNKLVGEMGIPSKEMGGSGALWVILRYRSR